MKSLFIAAFAACLITSCGNFKQQIVEQQNALVDSIEHYRTIQSAVTEETINAVDDNTVKQGGLIKRDIYLRMARFQKQIDSLEVEDTNKIFK